MKIKLFIVSAFLFLSSLAIANQSLPTCSSDVCTQTKHNKELEKLSIIVRNSKGQLIHSNQFDLDKDAKLVFTSSENGSLDLDNSDRYSTTSNGAPPAPCNSGACSKSVSRSYETATEIVTIVVTYTYYNGQLVGAHTTRYVSPKAAEIDP